LQRARSGHTSEIAIRSTVLPARYLSPRLLAAGGMGEVYVAVDELLEREVAVKLLAERYAGDEEIRRRFTREALAAARLSGERHVVTIYDVGEHEGRPFIVMAYMAGGSLEARLREGRVNVARALEWLEQAATALDRAHREGIVHRDVKPGNLLLDAGDNLHVGDFGIARAAGLDSLTSPGTVLGTAGYFSPEQALGDPVTPASDRYSLGVVAFELLTGARPFAAETSTAEAFAHVRSRPPSAHTLNADLPVEVDRALERALAKAPQERPASCHELVADLRAAFWGAESETIVRAPSAAPTAVAAAKARPRRGKAPAVLAGLACLAALGAVLGFALSRSDAPAVVTRAVHETVREQGRTSTVTVSEQGRTSTVTVTTPAAAPHDGTPSSDTRTPAQLNDAGYARLQANDAQGALPLLERAVHDVQGTGGTVEAYASYNLAWARFALGRCDGVLDLLDRSQQVQGYRKEIAHLRKQAEKRCGAHGKGNGDGNEGD
jgi:serine/threonine-protein kinase